MNITYGYCRISTPKQNIERQVRNILEAYPQAKIMREVYSGTKADRPTWDKLLRTVRPGDTIVFDSVSRMSRNSDDGIAVYMDLYERGVSLVYLKEHYIDTDTYRSALQQHIDSTGNEIADIYIDATNHVFRLLAERQIRIAFEQAQKEVDDLHQRTREGIETARRAGKQIGRQTGQKVETTKAKAAKEYIRNRNHAFGGPLTDEETWKSAGISRATYYRYKREMMAESEDLAEQ